MAGKILMGGGQSSSFHFHPQVELHDQPERSSAQASTSLNVNLKGMATRRLNRAQRAMPKWGSRLSQAQPGERLTSSHMPLYNPDSQPSVSQPAPNQLLDSVDARRPSATRGGRSHHRRP